MARDAALHAELGVETDEWSRERKFSLWNLAVALLAEQLSGYHVSAVGEAHELAKLVHALPLNRLSGGQHFHQLGLLAALSDCVFMAIEANSVLRDRGVLGIFRPDVTLSTRNLLFRYVDLVFKGYGLLDVARCRAAENEDWDGH
jgi:hypothetical protein